MGSNLKVGLLVVLEANVLNPVSDASGRAVAGSSSELLRRELHAGCNWGNGRWDRSVGIGVGDLFAGK